MSFNKLIFVKAGKHTFKLLCSEFKPDTHSQIYFIDYFYRVLFCAKSALCFVLTQIDAIGMK